MTAPDLGNCGKDHGRFGGPIGRPDPDRMIPALHNMGIPVPAENFVMNSQNGVVVWELLK